jgi:phosphohistidine phosphatase SixA
MRKSAVLALMLALVTTLSSTAAEAHRGIFVVRHAEKASQEPDALLSLQGEDRALALARLLRSAGVTHVVHTDRVRTRQTVEPLVEQKGLTPIVVPHADVAGLVHQLKALPRDAVVVVAAHSDTIAQILLGLGVTTPVTIRDDQYGRVFLVTESSQLIELAY